MDLNTHKTTFIDHVSNLLLGCLVPKQHVSFPYLFKC